MTSSSPVSGRSSATTAVTNIDVSARSSSSRRSTSITASDSERSGAVRRDARTVAATNAGPVPLPMASARVTRRASPWREKS